RHYFYTFKIEQYDLDNSRMFVLNNEYGFAVEEAHGQDRFTSFASTFGLPSTPWTQSHVA
ncbi:MAG: hypothetical protein SH847_15245, partial [Roseiflexaceae bacterium]|nr:hypothetical protein [Roseiflexaceae bacterium]